MTGVRTTGMTMTMTTIENQPQFFLRARRLHSAVRKFCNKNTRPSAGRYDAARFPIREGCGCLALGALTWLRELMYYVNY